ncbi:protein adenylyltransferase SelO [Dinoroseobacter sp. S375]|uniref:protein adenylyltransferase SelO n=1 Tax=Dinoroseobacter sp. S375 TaxID=3415136 RepID=UPI003C7BFEF7
MSMHIPFEAHYAALPDRFHARMAPTPVAAPALIAVNHRLARELGLDPEVLESAEGIAMLAGNAVAEGSSPLAQAYAGHQFGGFNPQLGDGRAILLGELRHADGHLRDIQLKGSGPTPFSRRGDGRAALGPVLREYILSEAMHALGVPTTRALAAVTTGERVLREQPMPGAVFTRVASSHLRVGTFQFFAARGDLEAVEQLVAFARARHDPGAETALDLLKGVIARQARLIAQWMGLGFIHGVMNTDNMTISGETIDYGPCAFMEAYHPETVYSSIDQFGRYAYGKQPEIAVWNLAQLATAMLPLIDPDKDRAIDVATEAVQGFADLYQAAWAEVFRAKLGLVSDKPGDAALAHDLLGHMAGAGVDFTLAFRGLAEGVDVVRALYPEPERFDGWAEGWRARLAEDDGPAETLSARLKAANPAYIPRNHRVEEAIQAGLTGDFAPFHALNTVLQQPFADQPEHAAYQAPARPEEAVRETFCGT